QRREFRPRRWLNAIHQPKSKPARFDAALRPQRRPIGDGRLSPTGQPETMPGSTKGTTMISARNQFKGKVKSVKLGNVMAEVVIDIGPLELVSVITRESAEKMGLKTGKSVTAIVKSTEVMVATKD